MSTIDELLENNRAFMQDYQGEVLPVAPRRRLAVVACMDSRLDLFRILGLRAGEAHVIRNAGGIATDDVLRSLTISQRMMGTEEIVLIQHDRCGQVTYVDDDLSRRIESDTGVRPPFPFLAFIDVDDSVRGSLARIEEAAFLPRNDRVRGFVFEHDTGRLREVVRPAG